MILKRIFPGKREKYKNVLNRISKKKLPQEISVEIDPITTRLNEIYSELDSSIDPFVLMAQAEVLDDNDDW